MTIDTEIPFPLPRLVTPSEILPQTNQVNPAKDVEIIETPNEDNKKEEKEKGVIMKIPEVLEEKIVVKNSHCVLNVSSCA